MDARRNWFHDPSPRLLRTDYGKWLAVSEPGAPVRIGVLGQTAESARERFARAAFEWGVLLTGYWNEGTARTPTPEDRA